MEAFTKSHITPIGLGPWSVSKLKVLQNCPLQFYLKYVLKLEPPKPVATDDDKIITQIGTVAHSILEGALSGGEVTKLIHAEEKKNTIIPADRWGDVAQIEYNVLKFVQRVDAFRAKHKVKSVESEKKVGITHDFKKTGFFAKNVWFRGVIDLTIRLDNDDVLIVDHKFGPDPAWGIKNYEFQLNTYLPLTHYGIAPIRGGQTGIHFIRAGELKLGNYTDLSKITGTIAREMEFYIQAAIDNVIERGEFFYERGTSCKYCDYKDSCESGKRKRTAGDLQKYVEESRLIFKSPP